MKIVAFLIVLFNGIIKVHGGDDVEEVVLNPDGSIEQKDMLQDNNVFTTTPRPASSEHTSFFDTYMTKRLSHHPLPQSVKSLQIWSIRLNHQGSSAKASRGIRSMRFLNVLVQAEDYRISILDINNTSKVYYTLQLSKALDSPIISVTSSSNSPFPSSRITVIPPTVVVLLKSGKLLWLSLHVYQKGRLVAGDGKRRRKRNTGSLKRLAASCGTLYCVTRSSRYNLQSEKKIFYDDFGGTYYDTSRSVTYSMEYMLEGTRQLENDEFTSYAVVAQNRWTYYLVGSRTGILYLYNLYSNTLVNSWFLSNATITSIEKIGTNTVGIASGSKITLLNLNTLELLTESHYVISDLFTNLAQDATHPGFFCAGTTGGYGLLLSISYTRNNITNSSSSDGKRPIYNIGIKSHQVLKSIQAQRDNVHVATFRGFIALKYDNNGPTVLYNSTKNSHKDVEAYYMWEGMTNGGGERTELFQATRMEAKSAMILHLSQGNNSSLEISALIESHLRYDYSDFSFDNIISGLRGPMMMLGIAALFAYQSFKKKRQLANDPMNQMSPEELEEFTKEFNKWDRARGGTGIIN